MSDGVLARLRPFKHSDTEAFAALLGASGGWPTDTVPTPAELHARWSRRHVDPETSIRLLSSPDGELVAAMQASLFSDGSRRMAWEAVVRPAWRRRGIGSAFHELALEKAHTEGATHLSTPVFVGDGGRNMDGASFLQKRGFTRLSAYWQMRVENLGEQPQPEWPRGIEVRPFLWIPNAAEKWASLIASAFDEPASAEGVLSQTQEPGSEPEGYFFALDTQAQQLIGTSRARLDPTSQGGVTGYVGTVGVLHPYRRRGIAQALILQTLHYLHSRGAESAVLFVEDRNTGARKLYEGLGWHSVYRSDNYWKTLNEQPANGRAP